MVQSNLNLFAFVTFFSLHDFYTYIKQIIPSYMFQYKKYIIASVGT